MYPGKQFMRDEHRDRGTAVHAAIELALRGELDESGDWAQECPTELAQVHAAIRCIEDAHLIVIPELIECPLYYAPWRVAGKLDLGVYCGGGEIGILDHKTGAVPGVTALQLALYGGCFTTPPRRFALRLKPDGYSITEYPLADLRRDLNDFGVCLRYLQVRERFGIKD
jgi:hypothetical protein